MSEAEQTLDEYAPLVPRIEDYLRSKLPQAEGLSIKGLKRLHGGASRETFRFDASWRDDSGATTTGMILRRDPEASLIDTERAVEFNAYRSFFGRGVPVPEPLFLESETRWLDRPFFVMGEIEKGAAAGPTDQDPYAPHQAKVGETFWRVLGRIAGRSVEDAPLTETLTMPAPEDVWRLQLDHWAEELERDELQPQPILRAAIRRLRNAPPPAPERVCIVHGDYRSGNFLWDAGSGDITAILDWEMAHLGDPHEDIAWAMDPLWGHEQAGRAAGLIPNEEGLAFWQEESGIAVNPESLSWYRLFAAVKGAVIWVSSAKEYATGANTDPVLAFAGWYCLTRHNAILLDLMEQGEAAA